MCGIIGYIGSKEVVPVLIEGLRRLEYRGYDSAGVAVVARRRDRSAAQRRQAVEPRAGRSAIDPIAGDYGVGHTRWATHGRPTEENAHPHRDCTGKIVVVHNGIIENYLDLKQELQQQGHKFVTETDTEIVAHLVEREMKDDGLENAVRRALLLMRGLFALVLISADDPEKIVTVRNGPPIVVGLGDGEFFVASDIPAILSHTRDVVFLGDEEMAIITRTGVAFTDFFGRPVSKATQRVLWDPIMAEKAGYKHFMLKEIFEQPTAARETILGRVSQDSRQGLPRGDEDHRRAVRGGRAGHDPRLRHVVARGAGRQVHDRAARARAGRGRLRLGVPLPQPDRRRRTRWRSSSRSRARPPTRSRRCARPSTAAPAASPSATSSAAWRRARPTARSTRTPARRSASRRPRRSRRSWSRCICSALRLGQARGTLSPEASQAAHRRAAAAAAAARADAEAGAGDRGDRRPLPHPHRFPVSRPRHQLPDRARGRAEAEGNLLHPRRGLSGRRDEARADRAHRRADAGRRHRAGRSTCSRR